MTTDQEAVLNEQQAAELELLAPGRRLPASARNVRIHVLHFQDTALHVRFDAPLVDARRFAEELIGQPLVPGMDPWRGGNPHLDWWADTPPAGSEGGNDEDRGGSYRDPPIDVLLLPRGNMATVWVHTFTL